MRLSRTRFICRSYNAFTPSIALWQHFVLPSRPFRPRQRLSSSVAAIKSADFSPLETNGISPPLPKAAETDGGQHGESRLRKVRSRKPSLRRPARDSNISKPVDPSNGDSIIFMAKTKREVKENGDYKGVVMRPMSYTWSQRKAADYTMPWYLNNVEQKMNGMDRLALEISRFHAYAKPSRTEALARRHLVERVRAHARQAFPDDVLEIFGSERTGLALATSDIDLRLVTKEVTEHTDGKNALPPTKADRLLLGNKLYRLKSLFQRKKDYTLCCIRHARYPLLSMQDRNSGLDVQVVLSNDTSQSRTVMSKYMEEYPYLRELYSVVKTMFDVRGLSDVFRGGFGSYAIFIMIIASLRHSPPKRRDAAGGLINFLQFWGEYDTSTNGISIEPTAYYNKEKELVMPAAVKKMIMNKKIKPLPKFMLSLRDPADPTNDLGRKGTCIKHVQKTCKHLYNILKPNLGEKPPLRMHLKVIVGPIYDLHYERRRKLEAQGQHVLMNFHGSLAAKATEIRKRAGHKSADTISTP